MPVTSIGHVNIRTPIQEETLVFFERCLGFRRAPGPASTNGGNNVWLFDENDAPLVHVSRPPGHEAPRAAEVKSRLDHVAFDCTDIAAFAARLEAEGVPYTEASLPGAGLRQLNLFDPNGIKIELTFRE